MDLFSGCGFMTSEGVDGSTWCSFGRLPFAYRSCFKQIDSINCLNTSARITEWKEKIIHSRIRVNVVLCVFEEATDCYSPI